MKRISILLMSMVIAGCASREPADVKSELGPSPKIAKPDMPHEVTRHPKLTPWPENATPKVPDGFVTELWAKDLDYPRWAYVLPNGDVVVSEARTVPVPERVKTMDPKAKQGQMESKAMGRSANRITMFRDTNKDGKPDERFTFLSNLSQPLGMLVLNNYFYVANTDGLWRYPYETGQTTITTTGEKLLDLPAGGYNNHWTRNIIASRDGKHLFITVGSGIDDEKGDQDQPNRAAILKCDPDGKNMTVYASGLRNPVGLAIHPHSGALWAAVNERDKLGDDLPPDYITAVQDGGFYGWPYAYWGNHPDPRHLGKRDDLVAKSITPDFALGSHTASLGLAFVPDSWPAPYAGGAMIGQHGSWNRSNFVGYKVVFVPFKDGKPSGPAQDFATGFIADEPTVYGRPCGATFLPDGSLLIMDDAADRIWRVKRRS